MAKFKTGKPIAEQVADAQQALVQARSSGEGDVEKLSKELADLEHRQAWTAADEIDARVVIEEIPPEEPAQSVEA